jgi:phosphinothricin acetyltransferase
MNAAPIIACTERHLPVIGDILNDAILHSAALYDYAPRTPGQIADWFQRRIAGNFPVIGIESAHGELAGFATYGPFRAFPGYKYTVEHSVYVAESHRGQGIGARLMRALIADAEARQFHVIVGVIDSANEASVRFHRAHGFAPCGTIREVGYKFGRWLDIEFYQLILRTPDAPVEGH